MKDLLCDKFQNSVDEVLIRHRSILDIITKLQESSAKINRAVIKSVTNCGCIKINASKHKIPENIDYNNINKYLDSHLKGELCEVCKEKIIEEMGRNLFYLSALANDFDISLYDIILRESKKIDALGKFNLY
ncbi:nucleoside triphosphate pyrophosphohydrolase family protein [Paramaledivibacter caminithermalis]|uniref:DUF1573 domain-containing protein n=1 Tax=Paramaledivibacter caminithermalis (strain DSM 15212 / CIP 107654 / DViRD3) TaxID=1121301 RepID=A0A1M6N2H1_PARC5|nr:DUF1573 domain-containing protein [Paramaledivibacter caminithermalis]SHJ89900.1 hypothetical protein SAMN02745912_01548 [Paramaledivibacter caminithermalis DSM 15212]